jgi:DNA-binding HxlR family transcriptional regulator
MPSRSACKVDTVLGIVGDRWSLGIIHELSSGPRRTLELLGAFSGLSSKTLADRLKKLERHQIVRRTSYPEAPPRVEYSLTSKGSDLLPVVGAISEAAERWNLESPASAKYCRACAGQQRGAAKEQTRSETKSGAAKKRTDVTLL